MERGGGGRGIGEEEEEEEKAYLLSVRHVKGTSGT